MIDFKDKVEVVNDWLEDNDFFNIKRSSDNTFIRADGYSSRIIIAVKEDESTVINVQEIIQFSIRTHRQVWIASVQDTDRHILWEII
ncbi:hypothetical protein [Flavobacterium cerinum]|uniref:DUF4253 domain-containing protein n=1 Tax=Flavobacterium cerinum TaxID=2502784 RepID=A0ABY5ITR0_9FLAO|nr:hypothetical protein [Flavobacterium cerinum]UUC46227.1 hypothetical protein NOX80_03235 [Flavobacterium cerinum]